MITLFIRNLPSDTTEANLTELFSTYGKVHSLKLDRDMFTGQVRGTALINMEGHEARPAMTGLDGSNFHGKTIYVKPFQARSGGRGRR